jgi:signal peptidase II
MLWRPEPPMRALDRIGILLSLGVIALDQFTKWLVDHGIGLHHSIPVIPQLVNLTHVRNKGAAFGILSNAGPLISTVVLTGFSLVAIGVIVMIWIQSRQAGRIFIVGLALILGGALGNLVDRFRLGEVIDFIDLYWRDLHWPAFNVADSAITVGVVLLLIHFLSDSRASSSR